MSQTTTERLNYDSAGIARAVELLNGGEVVAFPTETVYGLGADASNSSAVEKVYAAKGRPPGHPLIVHASDIDTAFAMSAGANPVARRLAEAFWPGPLTLIIERASTVADVVVGGRSTVGLRVPGSPAALDLCEAFGGGIAAPSANRFGGVSPTTAEHVLADLDQKIAAVLDGGPCEVGLESTIVEITKDAVSLLRPGAVTVEMLNEQLTALSVRVGSGGGASRAPGMLDSHYAPQTPLRIVEASELDEAIRASNLRCAVIAPFECVGAPAWQLPADAAGFGKELYAALRAADEHDDAVEQILVVPPAKSERFEAVMDRLRKAASDVVDTGSSDGHE